jgi:hypothetical protein
MFEIWFFDEFRMTPGYTSLTRDGKGLLSSTRLQALDLITYRTLMARRFLISGISSIYTIFILDQSGHLLLVEINTSSTTLFYWFTSDITCKFAEGALLPYF